MNFDATRVLFMYLSIFFQNIKTNLDDLIQIKGHFIHQMVFLPDIVNNPITKPTIIIALEIKKVL